MHRFLSSSAKVAAAAAINPAPTSLLMSRTLHTAVPSSLLFPSKVFSKSESRDFMAVFPDLVRELTVEGPYAKVPVVSRHLARCIQYNVPNGKKNRGLVVPATYRLLRPSHSADDLRRAYILGWCVEFLQAFFLVTDDVMDGSTTRRGQPCWHLKESLGAAAFNDSILLEASVYNIIDRHFAQLDCYPDLLREFHGAASHTAVGQSLDLLTSAPKEGKVDLDSYNMDRYNDIVKYKTAYYSFALPVGLGMRLAGIHEEKLHKLSRKVLLEMGHFFQVQDDFLDCFGDPAVTGKHGTDIRDGKCSWLIVVALQRANKQQRAVLKECYGSSSEGDVARVKAIYEELKIPRVFRNYEEESYLDIRTHIDQLPGAGEVIPPQIFTTFLERIYKRND